MNFNRKINDKKRSNHILFLLSNIKSFCSNTNVKAIFSAHLFSDTVVTKELFFYLKRKIIRQKKIFAQYFTALISWWQKCSIYCQALLSFLLEQQDEHLLSTNENLRSWFSSLVDVVLLRIYIRITYFSFLWFLCFFQFITLSNVVVAVEMLLLFLSNFNVISRNFIKIQIERVISGWKFSRFHFAVKSSSSTIFFPVIDWRHE